MVTDPGAPDDAALAALADAGATWIHTSGWIDDIGDLAERPFGPR